MSKFFKALQQAEQDHALRTGAERGAEAEHARAGDAADHRIPAHPAESDWILPGAGARSRRHGAPAVAIEGVDEHLVSLLRPSSYEAEQYRTLSNVVERLRETNAVGVVGISSPGAAEGKTITGINLASALAQDPRNRVLLLEADLRRPTLAKYLGLSDSERGLSHALARPGLGLAEVVTTLPGFDLDVLVAGHPSAAAYEVLKSARVDELFREARKQYDFVIVDTPPLVGAPEGRVIQNLVDGLLVVVRAHRTPRSLLEEALRLSDRTKILGLVYNADDQLLSGYGRYQPAGTRFHRRPRRPS
jgi:protein-tyrosine kinase